MMMSSKTWVCFFFVFAWTSSSNALEIDSDICQTYNNSGHASTTAKPGTITVGQVLDLLCAGEKALYKPNQTNIELVVVLGRIGTGKKTVVKYLAGMEPDSQPPKGDQFGQANVTFGNASSALISIPTWFKRRLTEAYFVYCPGFENDGGALYDIPTAHLTWLLLSRGYSVKILLAENYDNLVSGAKQLPLQTLLRHVAALIPDVNKFASSIGLLATKVQAPDSSRNAILKNITDFLNATKALYVDRPNSSEMKLLKALLESQSTNKSRIDYFPWVTDPKSPTLQTQLNHLDSTINQNLNFTSTKAGDFGYSVSDTSKLAIYQLLDQITDVIKSNVSSLTSTIFSNLGQLEVKDEAAKFWLLFDKKQELAKSNNLTLFLDHTVKELASAYNATQNIDTSLVTDIEVYQIYTTFFRAVSNNEATAPLWSTDFASKELTNLKSFATNSTSGHGNCDHSADNSSAAPTYVTSWISVLVLLHLGSINFFVR